MFIANRHLGIIDQVFATLDTIERFDAVALGEKVINFSATIAAVIIGVCSYVITALQLWWEDNGEVTVTRLIRFTFWIIDAVGATYYAGVTCRPIINYWVARIADTVLYNLTEVL